MKYAQDSDRNLDSTFYGTVDSESAEIKSPGLLPASCTIPNNLSEVKQLDRALTLNTGRPEIFSSVLLIEQE